MVYEHMYTSVYAPCLPTEFLSETNALFVRRGTGKHCLNGWMAK